MIVNTPQRLVVALLITGQYTALYGQSDVVRELRHAGDLKWQYTLIACTIMGIAAASFSKCALRQRLEFAALGIWPYMLGIAAAQDIDIANSYIDVALRVPLVDLQRILQVGSWDWVTVNPVALWGWPFIWCFAVLFTCLCWLQNSVFGVLSRLGIGLGVWTLGCYLHVIAAANSEMGVHSFLGYWGILPVALASTVVCVPLRKQFEVRHGLGEPTRLPRRVGMIAVCGALVLSFDLSRTKGKGEVILHEAHSEWSWTDVEFNENDYGSMTTYNYVSLRRVLEKFWDLRVVHQPITQERLASCNVLIIKMPTEQYEDREIETILEYVRRGGGLLLVGDHTNVFGASKNLNRIASQFGIMFEFDAVGDAFPNERQVLTAGPGLAHPALVHTQSALMATSCSLRLDWPAMPVLVGKSVYRDLGDYDNTSFFGNLKLDRCDEIGKFAQWASASYGDGRVLAFSDSTTLSTFTFWFPGIWDRFCRSIRYLDSRDPLLSPELRRIARLLLMLIAWLFLARWGMLPTLGLVVILWSTNIGANTWNAAVYSIEKIRRETNDVMFLVDQCDYRLPLTHETHEWDKNNYHTFFVWMQRIQRIPRVAGSLSEALTGNVLVLINPEGEVWTRPATLSRLEQFMEKGGHIALVVGSVRVSHASQIIARHLGFGELSIRAEAQRIGGSWMAGGQRIVINSAVVAERGSQQLVNMKGERVAAVVQRGDGAAAFLGIGNAMAVQQLGMPKQVPNAWQRALAEIEFRMMKSLSGGPR